jgi:hypothetical protein
LGAKIRDRLTRHFLSTPLSVFADCQKCIIVVVWREGLLPKEGTSQGTSLGREIEMNFE